MKLLLTFLEPRRLADFVLLRVIVALPFARRCLTRRAASTATSEGRSHWLARNLVGRARARYPLHVVVDVAGGEQYVAA